MAKTQTYCSPKFNPYQLQDQQFCDLIIAGRPHFLTKDTLLGAWTHQTVDWMIN